MNTTNTVRILGVGSPIVDLLVRVPETFLASAGGEKGGMELVDGDTLDSLLTSSRVQPEQAPGGSAANTTFALARMGMPTAFLGKLGMDADGDYYQEAYLAVNGDTSRFKFSADVATARCLSLITPDSERTMRTDLGAAVLLAPNEISPADFEDFQHAHVEGYLLFNQDLARKVLVSAKEAGCSVSLDLGAFEVVRAAQDVLPALLENYVDAVFANEDEGRAYCGHEDAEKALEELGNLCNTAAVKLGPDGAWLKRGSEVVRARAIPAKTVVDTTGAGDCWAAGFLYGHLNGLPLEVCGELGALLGAAAVQEIGASPSPASWEGILARIAEL